MIKKPFKVPFAAPRPAEQQSHADGPQAKRVKLSPEAGEGGATNLGPAGSTSGPKALGRPGSTHAYVGPSALLTASEPCDNPAGKNDPDEDFFSVLWRKPTTKKHKIWDGDGVIAVRGGLITLYDESGKAVGRTKVREPLASGSAFSIGGRDVEVDSSMTKDEYRASKPVPKTISKPNVRELDAELCTNIKFNAGPSFLPAAGGKVVSNPIRPFNPPPVKAKSLTSSFKSPLLDQTTHSRPLSMQSEQGDPIPRHDPKASGAVVMKRPLDVPRGKRVVDVVVDPCISKSLRDHQKEGVKFMYECVMGIKGHGGMGAILADQMGLGKSLQVIALLWTLLKQNPIFDEPPVIRKAVIVCPATVVRNWKKEFRKWLGERVGVFVMDDKKARMRDFTHSKTYGVMIIGYERFRSVQEDLEKGSGVDIVIADEGHRLKTAKNKAGQAFKSMKTDRRIILTGTPLQNDLTELYFVSDMVNPGLLGKPSAFKKEFETPIARAAESDATPQQVQKGQSRGAELAEMTSMYILRRTMEILADYLPPKTETIIFCKPTKAQAEVYKTILASPVFGSVLGNTETTLQFISVLKKVCNSPNLLRSKDGTEEAKKNETIAQLLSDMPPKLLKFPGASVKLQILDSFLHILRTTTEEKIVIVSHYTSTLDIIGNLISSMQLNFLRLDGSTPNSKRQPLIDKFNRTPADQCFAFLLSAKSGGAGINLIGASRLILFDVDWNPSTEDQAMARIHRDGQKRHCRIYRLLVQGALDEKIYQRQLTKRALADAIVDGKHSTSTFSREELRRLFSLDEADACQTHELLGCTCAGRGLPQEDSSHAGAAHGEADAPPSDDDDEPPALGELMTASQALRHETRSRSASPVKPPARAPAEMQSLMRYRHIDPARLAADAADEDGGGTYDLLDGDEVLQRVLREAEVRVGYVFLKTFARAAGLDVAGGEKDGAESGRDVA